MIFPAKKITLKDGRGAVLRSPGADDAAALIEIMRTCAAETEYVIRYPEECIMTQQQEAEFIERSNASPYDVMTVCETSGDIAGICSISFERHIKTRHRASVAIAIKQKYWGLGIGTAMFSEMIASAREKGVLQLELDYIEGNERARRLYEKAGFMEVARRPDAIRLRDGTKLSEISMIKKL